MQRLQVKVEVYDLFDICAAVHGNDKFGTVYEWTHGLEELILLGIADDHLTFWHSGSRPVRYFVHCQDHAFRVTGQLLELLVASGVRQRSRVLGTLIQSYHT